MLLVAKVLAVVSYLVGVATVAIYSKPLAEEVGNDGMVVPVTAAVLWPLLVAVGVLWSLSLHLAELVRGQ